MLGTELLQVLCFLLGDVRRGASRRRKENAIPTTQGWAPLLPPLLHSRPKPYSSARISSEAHHGPELKFYLGKRPGYPTKAGRR